MTQLTLRGFDAELERALKRLAREQGLSLNQAALKLLRRGAGLGQGPSRPVGAALDPFVGSLARDDADALARAGREADAADLELQRRPRRRK